MENCYILKYKYLSEKWGMRSMKEGDTQLSTLPEVYSYIVANEDTVKFIGLQEVTVTELDIEEHIKLAKQSSSYIIDYEIAEVSERIYLESYKAMVDWVKESQPLITIKSIVDPYRNDLTKVFVK